MAITSSMDSLIRHAVTMEHWQLVSSSSGNTPLLAAALFLLSYMLYKLCTPIISSAKKAHLALPPGPQGVPILGMTAKVLAPGKKHATLFHDWERQYGGKGILRFPTLFREQIIISDAKAAQALLEKRGPQYSYRAPNYFFDKLRGNGLNLVAMEGGPQVDQIRKLFHEEMSPRAVPQHRELQTTNAYITALKLIHATKQGETVADVVEKTQKALTLRTFCGKLSRSTLKNVETIEAEIDSFKTPPIAGLLDLFPSLQNIPSWCFGGQYKRECERYSSLNKKLWDELQAAARQNEATAPEHPSIWGNMIRSNAFARHGFSDDEASFIIGHQLGSNFVPAAIFEVFFLAMLHNPHIFRKAQEEVDRVIGRKRLPTLADEHNLPYIRALQLELLRWRPVVPLVQPHIAARNDDYDGMHIPAGSLVWANLQAMSKDENVYPDSEAFKPERFLTPEGTFTRRDEISIFGYGKRRCPGAYLADPILFINLATFAWALDLKLADDMTSPPSSDVEAWYTYITFVVPPPFKACITARDANVETLLRAGAADWEDVL